MASIAWMAWTPPTAIFFCCIALMLAIMTGLALRYPETERVGVLRIATTRGDRLFISLLGAAYIHLAWLGIIGPDVPLYWATLISLVYALGVFRWVGAYAEFRRTCVRSGGAYKRTREETRCVAT